MSLLLDTHIVLWWLADDPRLDTGLRELIRSTPLVSVSAATAWEIAVKRSHGMLEAPTDLAEVIVESGFTPLSITIGHAEVAGSLPRHHEDPFDRMLVAQALVESLAIVSVDPRLLAYDVEVIGP